MGRDFARKGRNKVGHSNESSNHWLWLLAGTAMGIAISVVAVFKLFPVVYPKIAHLESAPNVAEKTAPKQEEKARTPHFDFYSLLPEIEVVVPQTADAAPQVAQTTNETLKPETVETTANTTDAGFRLQLGSFRKYEDADRLKAQMALTGIQVEIEAVTLAPNDTWYRVRSAAYANRESAESVRAQLQAQSIQSLLVEEKG